MQVQLRILRYDPQRDRKPHWESYVVEAGPIRQIPERRFAFHARPGFRVDEAEL